MANPKFLRSPLVPFNLTLAPSWLTRRLVLRSIPSSPLEVPEPPMSLLPNTAILLGKELRTEFRSRELLTTTVVFILVVLILFSSA